MKRLIFKSIKSYIVLLMHKLFSYGTIQDPLTQQSLFKKILKGTADSITGFDKKEIKLGKNTYPILISNQKSTEIIKGTCYTLTEREILICDDYEGKEYKRIEILLNSKTKAWVYIKA
ncbi:gamma-glutamylcyclotransferase [Wenyingzhuangia sp. IMCC45467]